MGKVVVTMNLTLDGVMQAPARPDEDGRGGFAHGGWAAGYGDQVMAEAMGRGMARSGAMLLGRRTYQDFYRVWAGRTGNPFSAHMDESQKYVASRTLTEPLPWQNSTRLPGDAADAVAKLKQGGPDLSVIGSGELARSLARRELVDTYVLLIYPVVLGAGQRLFPDGAPPARLRLTESLTTSTGVIIATYQV